MLDARAEFPNSTLADLYDIDVMPHQLRKAHQELDKAVDKLYLSARKASSKSSASSFISGRSSASLGAGSGFTGDRDRVEHLFGLYELFIAPLAAAAPRPRKRRATRNVKSVV